MRKSVGFNNIQTVVRYNSWNDTRKIFIFSLKFEQYKIQISTVYVITLPYLTQIYDAQTHSPKMWVTIAKELFD